MGTGINQLLGWSPNERFVSMPMITSDRHRLGMRNLAAGVTIITASDGTEKAGLTATAVCSITADPPRLVAMVGKQTQADGVIMRSGALAVNVLAGDQEAIAKIFAGMVEDIYGEDRFGHGEWYTLVTDAPVLAGSLVSFDCRVIKAFDESSHHAFLCEVLDTRESAGNDALLYANGAFRRLG